MRCGIVRILIVGATVFLGLGVPMPAFGYSVLAHEANIDALWDGTIKPMLQARFPGTTTDGQCKTLPRSGGGMSSPDEINAE